MRSEAFLFSAGTAMDVAYPLPADRLQPFWTEVVRFAQAREGFQEPLLMVMAHDLKLYT